jgi:GNAT superfamily N-acetyltransferase
MAHVFPDDERTWRITCFVTHKDYRGRGVSAVALRAAMRAIRASGGGLVEAYPVVVVRAGAETDPRRAQVEDWHRELNRILAKYGGRSIQAKRHLEHRVRVTEEVRGLGSLDATYWQGFHGGTVPLFEAEGFRAVSVIPSRGRLAAEPTSRPARILMRRTV